MMLNEVFKRIENHTLLDFERIASLWRLAHYINDRGIRGDFVECGSYKGGSSAVLRMGMGPQRKLWIYDSFQGMPKTCELDGEEAKKYEGTCVACLEDVVEILNATGARRDEFIIVEGLFEGAVQHDPRYDDVHLGGSPGEGNETTPSATEQLAGPDLAQFGLRRSGGPEASQNQ